MHGYTYHIEKNAGTNMIRTEDQTIRTIIFLCRFRRYLVRHNVGIRLAIHLYEWPHDSFGRFSLPEFLKIIIELVCPDKFIHCCQIRVLVCIAYGMIHCTLEYAPYFLYGIQIWMSDGIPQDNNVAICKEFFRILGCMPRCLVQYQDHLAYLPVHPVHMF